MTGRPSRTILPMAGMAAVLSGCGRNGISFLFPYGIVAASKRDWFLEIVALVAIVVLPTFVLVPACAWHDRRRNDKATYRPD